MSNNHNNNNMSNPEESRKLWPFFFIIPILGFSFLPISGSTPPYAINFASWKTGAFAVANLPNTFAAVNCTGITTNALNVTGPGNVLITGQYTAKENVTNIDYQLIVGVGGTQPTTSFSNGDCSATNFNEWFLVIHFDTILKPLTTEFSVTITPQTGGRPGTMWGWLAIQNVCAVCVGGVQFQSSGQRAGSQITMLELK